ncbi:uncharacterized protein Z520_02626 [Fonsecaea multimorphosa CBS 102226]|uniref:Uncharacterized protein n=1 Tax=Fonsecaea multimorphosa CBS 102226 TaxID=1442371 RepID=A0A0D2KWA8_9EURO|nr:uncharacterized protein Z520_02626 [Fonsecaea multimorphosa CBS 102226]KIY01074.1 hypothetical protein Z520_02626 [Fonsecaea multimorphosa CBS 102226]OAL28696.1 hypothetical protein AYO22_02561 [Fonsecaea multimorphosa]
MEKFPESGILVEAEEFDDYGGWVLDSQFDLEMGSPYLLAHGNGRPVVDAKTTISISEANRYNVWVRAKDWVPGRHPGRFTVEVNGSTLDTVFGANDLDWSWQFGGIVELPVGEIRLALHDLTGFCGRCDAIFFGRDDAPPPQAVNAETRAWRRRLRGLPQHPIDAGTFDVVVIGGGVPGVAAALTAARLGERVALVHDRPYLGGNASVEIGLRPRGVTGPLIDEISQRKPNGDIYAKELLDAEARATVFLEHAVYNVVKRNSTIICVDARHARSGREIRLTAPLFIDCSGKAIVGLLSGAETLFGQESQAEYGEKLAPLDGNNMHHGNTVFFRTRMADSPVSFPPVPWATEVAKDFSDLGGQLTRWGVENGPGPAVTTPKSLSRAKNVPRRMTRPLTHFWEYGQWLDPYTHGEHIRDFLLCAIYGTFWNVKTRDPETYANLEFDHVAYVAAQGEFRRYKGDYVLTENDIRNHKQFRDAVVQNEGAFCLHYPGDEEYDFRLRWWEWDERDGKPYDIPFRCLYSVNVSNLMMAGKHMSATHVASSNTKFMGNGGQHAIATAAAAHLCKKYSKTPRGIYENHLPELQKLAATITGTDCSRLQSYL